MKKYILKTPERVNTKIDYENELNFEQFDVVVHADGPSLVLAGAGSGKTRTLVYRVAYLLERGVDPRNILLVTFTNKAASEMTRRVEELVGERPRGLWSGTFHHIANMLLRKYGSRIGISEHFTILDQDDAESLLKNIMKTHAPNTTYFPKPRVVKSILSYCINSQTPIREYLRTRYKDFPDNTAETLEKIFAIYAEKKLASGNVDFDDLLFYWLRILEEDKEVCHTLSNMFHYILVDEYQDTNRIQAKIIRLLAETHKNILVVGDDAQSIYSFRAAEVENILRFPEEYKNAKIFRLEKNYRSSPEILTLANAIIRGNSSQFEKNLQPYRASLGKKPIVLTLQDGREQAEFVVQRVLERHNEGLELSHVAVLFRAAYQSLELELELSKRQIPYIMRGGLKFFEQAHIKDVVSYLKILSNKNDELSWRRVLIMQDGIGIKGAEKIIASMQKNESSTSHVGLQRILLSLEKMKLKSEEGLGSMILTLLESGYEQYVVKNYEKSQDRLEDIRQMARFAAKKTLEDFLSEVMLSEGFRGDVNRREGDHAPQLVLSTIHQAKGLEWNTVFLIGLCEGQFPHYRVYENPKELEEERRLFYVATTRAEEELYLTSTVFQGGFQGGTNILRRSQFLEEIPSSLLEGWETEEENHYVNDWEGEGILDRVARLQKKY